MFVSLEKDSPCKVNLLLNILGKRPDGFHELETVFYPVRFCDRLAFSRAGAGIQLTCNDPVLPVDGRNLVYRAAESFLREAGIAENVRIHLEKRIPLAAQPGRQRRLWHAAATTCCFRPLNELLRRAAWRRPAALAWQRRPVPDIPFFLQSRPALATGRGEHLIPCDSFPALRDAVFLLIHPGFGISTAWAYQNLARVPTAFNGRPGLVCGNWWRCCKPAARPRRSTEVTARLEAPAFEKYPLLALLSGVSARPRRDGGCIVMIRRWLTFNVISTPRRRGAFTGEVRGKFGVAAWTAMVPAWAANHP